MSTLPTTNIGIAFFVTMTLVAGTSSSGAQGWPARPITMIVPFAAGGPTDVAARILAQQLTSIFGQQVIIENVGGGGGMTGASRVTKGPRDGYLGLHGNVATYVYAQILHKKPLYDARTEFAPIGVVVESQRILIVRKDLPVNDLPSFIAYAKANQTRMQYGSAGAGSGTHIGCLLLNTALGTNITHIPYRGSGPAMQDLVAGRIDFLCDVVSTALPQIQAGAVKAVVNMSATRSSVLPSLPTAQEHGFAGFDTSGWDAYGLPKGTPEPIVRRLNEALDQALDLPALLQRYEALGLAVPARERRGPNHLSKLIADSIARWERPIKESGTFLD